MNIARTLCFKQELKEKSVLLDLDAVQTVLIAENSAFILSFNPSITERTDKLCLDIQNVPHLKSNSWSDEESDEEPKGFSLEKKFEIFYDRGVKSVKGQHLKEFKRSMLAILSGKSSLSIFMDNFGDPNGALNFHKIMRNEAEKSLKVPLHSLNSEAVRRQTFEALFDSKSIVICMCWSLNLLNFPPDVVSHVAAYFAVSHSSGFVTIWGVSIHARRFDLLCGIDAGDAVVEEMYSFNCGKSSHLCMSFQDGRVCLVDFVSSDNETNLLNATYIWDDKDYIATGGMVYLEQQQMLVIPKNQHLILLSFYLSDDKKRVFSLQILTIDARFYISGVVPFTSELILGTFDGHLFKVNLAEDKKLHREQMPLPWNSKDWNIFGIQTTKNKLYLIAATYPSNFYCSRIVKQPSLVHFMSITSMGEIGELIINHSGPVYEIYDALCHLKFELAHGSCWPQSLIDYMNDGYDADALSLQKLKVLRCILSIRHLYIKEEEKELKERLICQVRRTEVFIFMNHIQATYGMLCSWNLESLLTIEKSSLTLMKHFMSINSPNSNFVLHEMFSHNYNEICPICSGSVKLDDHEKGSCNNGHIFPRCCQTLLLCTELPYRTCIVCKSNARQKIDEHSLFSNILKDTCTYCDGQLKLLEGF